MEGPSTPLVVSFQLSTGIANDADSGGQDNHQGANMDDRQTNLKNTRIQSHQAFIERQNHCPLCGSELEIQVETYLENFTLREEARCPSCDVMTRVKDHKMH